MDKYDSMLRALELGNISDYRQAVERMTAQELAEYSYWLHTSEGTYSPVLIVRAFLHNKLTFESLRRVVNG